MQYAGTSTPATQFDHNVYDHWKHQKIQHPEASLEINHYKSEYEIYACIFVNFGNWNSASGHCFDPTLPLNQAYDNGVGNVTNPPMSDSTSDVHYIRTVGKSAIDCSIHSSDRQSLVHFQSNVAGGENMVLGSYSGLNILSNNELNYDNADPYPACSWGTKFLFLVKEPPPEPSPDGVTPWYITRQEFGINASWTDGSYIYGELGWRITHDAQYGSTLQEASWSF